MTIRSRNLITALEFLRLNIGLEFLPDEIKERNSGSLCYEGRITCSHASTGRMLRRAEQNGTEYKGLVLRRGSRRNAKNNEDLATFYLADK